MPGFRIDDLADYVERHLVADERRAASSHKGPQAYSAELHVRLVAAVEQVPRLLHEPGCAQAVLRRIRCGGSAAFGLMRLPDIESVRRAVEDVRRRNPPIPVTGTREIVGVDVASRLSSPSTTSATT
jgi:hypothetical protein